MKNIIYILFFVVFVTSINYAQHADSISTQKKAVESSDEFKVNSKDQKDKSLNKSGPKFIDEDGDGINDLTNNTETKKQKRKHDRFVDRDGDGINDNRVGGMGWGNHGKEKGFGRHRR